MIFSSKLRKIGNSLGVIIPKNVITNWKEGNVITLDVITKRNVITKKKNVITSKRTNPGLVKWCDKHDTWNITCGCKL